MAHHRAPAGRGASSTASGLVRPHRPRLTDPGLIADLADGEDPQEIAAAASRLAHALVAGGRAEEDPDVVARLVGLVREVGVETLAGLWADAPAVSLAGALWRLYALQEATARDGERWAAWYRAGHAAHAARAVAGAVEPPGPEELRRLTDTILTGAYRSELDVALERAGAYARVVALGQAEHAAAAEHADPAHAARLTLRAARMISTAEALEAAARSWRDGSLD
ncbi:MULTISPECIES: hypothetical protein [Micrococcus]|uniref:hypothetical protein n=1 Tax=Micrococcus TaxID=1269 RepID=UPI001CCCF6F9|nr:MULTISPECIES: hypothetical protein [Micrococcus]MCG7422797.1 hypothetical protein [Micrococcus sp. ACRRV]UBH24827.1 hypothetical protein KW076_01095 [Micrococcus porci]